MDKVKKLQIFSITGVILFLPYIIIQFLRLFEIYEFNLFSSLVILLLFAVGAIIAFVSNIMLIEERRKEKEKSLRKANLES